MKSLGIKNIGIIIDKGFNEADAIQAEAVFSSYPLNRTFYLSSKKGSIKGKTGLELLVNETFQTSLKFNILILLTTLKNKQESEVFKVMSQNAQYVIATVNTISSLEEINILKNKPLNKSFTQDGKFFICKFCTGIINAAFNVLKLIRGESITKFIEMTLEYGGERKFNISYNQKMPAHPEKPLKIAVLLPDGFYAPDAIGAVDVFSYLPNSQFFFVSNSYLSKSIYGFGPSIYTNTTLIECPQVDIIIVGALSPKCFSNKSLQNFLLLQEKNAKAIIGVCAGVLYLGSLNLLKNKEATTNFQQLKLLKEVDAKYTNSSVVKDGKFYTSGPAVFSYKVGIEVVNDLVSEQWAHYIEDKLLEFNPEPVYNIGYPMKASKAMQAISSLLFYPLNIIYKKAILKNKSPK